MPAARWTDEETTVNQSVQPAPAPLRDSDRGGELPIAACAAAWAAVGPVGAPAALLLPAADDLLGWPASFVGQLLANGLQVVVITVGGQAAEDTSAVVDAAVAGMQAAGVSRAHVVGASQGGLVAQALAATRPDLVASLTLLMTRRPTAASLDISPGLLSVLAPPRVPRLLPGRAAEAIAAVASVGGGQAERAAPAEAGGADPVTALLCFASGEDSVLPPLPAGVPATVVHGEADPVVPVAAGRALAAALGGELVVVPGRHDLPWGREVAVARGVAAHAAAADRARNMRLPGPHRPGRRFGFGPPSRLGTTLGVVFVLLLVAVIAASTISVPYYAIRPGTARRTNDLVEVPQDRRFPPRGQLLFVTVGVGRLKALGWLLASRDDDVEIVPESVILGTTPSGEYREQVNQEMVDAKESATVVALGRLCEEVSEQGTGARVDQVAEGSPAAVAGIVRGDTVTTVDGMPVTTAAQALTALRGKPPGAVLVITVVGPTEGAPARTSSVTLARREDDPGRSFLGVTLRTRQQDFDLPFEVSIDSGRVGGPSAGLEFALSIIDQLTPGELTGGAKVAVTGTIELDGSVGPVGGIPQKTVTVQRAGAKLFLVPKEQVAEAQAKAGASVEVVGVGTLEEAIQVLAGRGGDISGIPGVCPGG